VPLLTPHYEPWVVAASIAIAIVASYVSLHLVERVRAADRVLTDTWVIGGSLGMGTGMWSMHFVGMQAATLPFEIGFTTLPTIASWASAVTLSALALWMAATGELRARRLWLGALAMGLGICATHYIGIAALSVQPPVVWNHWLVAGSVLIAVLGSAAALHLFRWLRRETGRRRLQRHRFAAALLMALAISGTYYCAMSACGFAAGTTSNGVGGLRGAGLATLVSMVCITLLALALGASVLIDRMQSKSAALVRALRDMNAQLRRANEELQQRAVLDVLTHLPNRTLFEDRLMHAVRRSRRDEQRIAAHQQEKLAVLFVDLDGFKAINESLGHSAGDEILKEAARRLRRTARDNDTVARVSADEFLVLMEDVPSVAVCAALAQRLLGTLSQPFPIAGRELHISGSIGIAVYPDHGHHERLIANADAAMNAAKRAGGNGYALFESHMNAGALEQLSLQSDLRHALERDELQLVYQPKLDALGGQLCGAEALLRWRHPERGMVSPSLFVPVAERFGLINALGDWIIDEACRQSRAWSQAGLQVRIAVNLSAQQLRLGDLVGRVHSTLQRHQVDPSQLLCEITESVAMEDIRATQITLENLEKIGVFLSIDDFGTGYSSLSYLRQLPVRELKIDRSFVNDLESSTDACAVVDAVVRLAHALGLRVVAEGVETAKQHTILRHLSCDELQGFLFAHPMNASEFLSWARTHDYSVAGPAPAPTTH